MTTCYKQWGMKNKPTVKLRFSKIGEVIGEDRIEKELNPYLNKINFRHFKSSF